MDAVTQVEQACAAAPAGAGDPDLTWLLHRAAHRMRSALDEVATDHGLANGRDWVVLGALVEGPPRTQLALAGDLGVDKTTLTALLDRLEAAGLIVRGHDERDRRSRIPAITPEGTEVHGAVTVGRDRVEAHALAGFTPVERDLLRTLLQRLTADGDDRPPGSCM